MSDRIEKHGITFNERNKSFHESIGLSTSIKSYYFLWFTGITNSDGKLIKSVIEEDCYPFLGKVIKRFNNASDLGDKCDLTKIEASYIVSLNFRSVKNRLISLCKIRDKLRSYKSEEIDEEQDLRFCDHLMSIITDRVNVEVRHIIEMRNEINISRDEYNKWYNFEDGAKSNKNEKLLQARSKEISTELKRLRKHGIILGFLLDDSISRFVFRIAVSDDGKEEVACIFPILQDYERSVIRLDGKFTSDEMKAFGQSKGHVYRLTYEWKRYVDYCNVKESLEYSVITDDPIILTKGSINSDTIDKWHDEDVPDDEGVLEPGNPGDQGSRKSVWPTEDDEDGLPRPVRAKGESDGHFELRQLRYEVLHTKFKLLQKEKSGQPEAKDKGKAKEGGAKSGRSKSSQYDDDVNDMDNESDFPSDQEDLAHGDYGELIHLIKLDDPSFLKDKKVRNKFSHKKRFNDRYGKGQLVDFRQIRDDDWIVELKEGRSEGRRYIVTFGGDGKFPIFNRIDE